VLKANLFLVIIKSLVIFILSQALFIVLLEYLLHFFSKNWQQSPHIFLVFPFEFIPLFFINFGKLQQ